MARFNQRGTRPAVHSPVTTTGERTVTHQGATGYLRDAKSELFLLSVSNFVSADTFYEKGGDRDDRYTQLVRQLAVEDPEWTAGLLGWLRGEGNMRSAALVGAAEFAHARLEATRNATAPTDGSFAEGWNRRVIASVLQRADEPGEMLGYWTSKYGRKLPKPVKRGIADAVQRLYNGKALLKYDTASKGYRFGDVLNLVHAAPDPDKLWQGELFRYALDRRHNPDSALLPESNHTLAAHHRLMQIPVAERRAIIEGDDGADRLAAAGVTWEALAGWLQGPMDKAAWEAIIPSMGVMALARNLRNFDEAGVSDEVAAQICARFTDPTAVNASRMFPFRWWAAYKHAPSLRWAHALEQALNHSLSNVPRLKGSTLILVDRSPSMFPGYGFSTPNAVGHHPRRAGRRVRLRPRPARREADARRVRRRVQEADRHQGRQRPQAHRGVRAERRHRHPLRRQEALVRPRPHRHRHRRTDPTRLAPLQHAGLRRHAGDDDRRPRTEDDAGLHVEHGRLQARGDAVRQSGRHTFGGLTDHAFRMVPLLEAGRDATWPWASKAA
jgi:hypothetical protein